jgi:type VI secretion system Hcp family effector
MVGDVRVGLWLWHKESGTTMASEMFLDIKSAKTGQSIGGDSIVKGYENKIQIKKFTMGMASPEDYSTKQATGKPNMDDVEIEFPQSSISATLMTMLTTNEQISQATLQVLKATGTNKTERLYLEWRFKNARLTSYKQSNSEDQVTDTIKIGYVIVEMDSYAQKSDGSMTNKKSSTYDGNKGEKSK